jgi:hypothetical protein
MRRQWPPRIGSLDPRRFCYRDDVLIEKSAYDMGSGVHGGDAGADICVWRAASSEPNCS